jgi:alpha-D-ribose 1-methylphosphonate 5-triphosphate synthase subunit PhnH
LTSAATDLTSDLAYASQATFRALMDCFARPDRIGTIRGVNAPPPLAPATAALLLCLADFETPIWLDRTIGIAQVADWIRFHTGALLVDAPSEAALAVCGHSRDLPEFTEFALGTDEFPDRSTTLILQVDRLRGSPIEISGPGIKNVHTFAAEPLPADFAARWRSIRELYPRGIDLVLIAGEQIRALPRSIRVMTGT